MNVGEILGGAIVVIVSGSFLVGNALRGATRNAVTADTSALLQELLVERAAPSEAPVFRREIVAEKRAAGEHPGGREKKRTKQQRGGAHRDAGAAQIGTRQPLDALVARPPRQTLQPMAATQAIAPLAPLTPYV